MGELIDLNPKAALTDADIPQLIARDTETAAAVMAHEAKTDPHPQYEFRANFASKVLAGANNFPVNTWTTLGTFPGFDLGVMGVPSAILVGISFCRDVNAPWKQSCCAALLGTVWWQPINDKSSAVRVPLEIHNTFGSFLSICAGSFSADARDILIYPESNIVIPATGRVNIILKRLL